MRKKIQVAAIAGINALAMSAGVSATEIVISSAEVAQRVLADGDSLTITAAGSVSTSSGAAVLASTSIGLGNIVINGSIDGAGDGIEIVDTVTLVGAIINTGSITAVDDGVSVIASSVSNGVAIAGTLSAGDAGVRIRQSTVRDGLSNSGQLVSGDHGLVVENGSSLYGGLTNSGSIASNADDSASDQGVGIRIFAVTNLFGGVLNSGSITTRGADAIGVLVAGASVAAGGVVNTGTIIANNSDGIEVRDGSTLSGGIRNTGTVLSAGQGISLGSGAAVSGDLVNTHVVTSSAGEALRIENSAVLNGALVNSGVLTAALDGVLMTSGATVNDGFNNTGSIIANQSAVALSSSAIINGDFENSGVMTAGAIGLEVSSGSSINGAFFNRGSVTTTGAGVAVTNGATIAGGVDNAGSITAGAAGISVDNSASIAQGIQNTGTIVAAGNGLGLGDGGQVSGGITNGVDAAITSSAAAGFYMHSGATLGGSLTNAGRIQGVTGLLFDVAPVTADVTNTGSIIASAVAVGGDMNGTLVNTGSIYAGTQLVNGSVATLDNRAGATLAGGFVSGSTSSAVSNAGVWALKSNVSASALYSSGDRVAATLRGSYVQGTSGTLIVKAADNLGGNNYSDLLVTGTVTLDAGTTVYVDVDDGGAFLTDGETLTGVVRTDGSTLTASTLTLMDNSLAWNFLYTVNATSVDLVATATGLTTLTDTAQSQNTTALAAVIEGQSGSTGALAAVTDALNGMSDAAAIDAAVGQILPTLAGDSAMAQIQVAGLVAQALETRKAIGLSAGSDFEPTRVWAGALAADGRQRASAGVSGFDSQTVGVAVGVEADNQAGGVDGVLMAHSTTSLDSRRLTGSTDHSTVHFGAYRSRAHGDIQSLMSASISHTDTRGARTIAIGSTNARAHSAYDSWGVHLRGELSKALRQTDRDEVRVGATLSADVVKEDAYTETGAGTLNLKVSSRTTDAYAVGGFVERSASLAGGWALTGRAGLAYNLSGDADTLSVAFQSQPNDTFAVTGSDVARLSGNLAVSAAYAVGERKRLSVGAQTQARDGYWSRGISAKFEWLF